MLNYNILHCKYFGLSNVKRNEKIERNVKYILKTNFTNYQYEFVDECPNENF